MSADASNPASAAGERPLAGIACLCAGLMFFAAQDAVVKLLVGDYPVMQILLLRSVVAVPLLALVVALRHGVATFRTPRPRLHAGRSLLVLTAFLCFYTAVGRIPLVDVVALFSAAPLFITALAGPVLGERVGPRRWLAVGVGFAGVLIMLKPGSDVFEPIALLGLVAALAYSGSALTARKIGTREPSPLLSFFSNLAFLTACGGGVAVATWTQISGPGATAALVGPWVAPGAVELGLMLATGLITLMGFILVPRAYQIAPASVVTPFEYTYLVWAMIVGLVFFGEVPSGATLLGAALVVSAGIYIARREARLAAQRTRGRR